MPAVGSQLLGVSSRSRARPGSDPAAGGSDSPEGRGGRAAAWPRRRRGGLNAGSGARCLVFALSLRAKRPGGTLPGVIEKLREALHDVVVGVTPGQGRRQVRSPRARLVEFGVELEIDAGDRELPPARGMM